MHPARPHASRPFALWCGRLAAVVLGVIVPLIALEWSLRAFGPWLPGNYDTGAYVQRHPVLGHFHVPDFDGWVKTTSFTTRITINPMGLRDPRQEYAKPPGTFRVLTLGDSYVEGAQVQVADTVALQLERLLNRSGGQRTEVLNGGVFGYGTLQEYLLLELEGEKYAPDLVILYFYQGNDLSNNNFRLELKDENLEYALKPYLDVGEDGQPVIHSPPPPSRRTDLRQRIREHSMLYNVIETGVVYKFELANPREEWNAVGGFVELGEAGKYDVRPKDEWERSWQITEEVLARMRDRTAAMGIPLVIVSVPDWRMLDRPYWQRDTMKRRVANGQSRPTAPVELLAAVSERLGVPMLDLLGTFQPVVDAHGLDAFYIPGDLHWTVAGHAEAARATAEFLQARELIPARHVAGSR